MQHQFDPKNRRRSLKIYLFLVVPILFIVLFGVIMEYRNVVTSRIMANWFNILSTAIGIGGLLLSYIFYIKAERQKIPCIALRWSKPDLENDFPDVRIVYEVYYKDKKIEKATTTKIAFWNGGKGLIEHSDIVKSIKIKPKDGFEILSYQIKYVSEETNNVKVILERGEIKIEFDYFDYGDGVVLKVLHTGNDENDFLIEGKVKGAKQISFPDTSTPPSNFLTKSDYYYHDYL